MGRMLLPEGLSGRCFPFSFFQLTRDLPGPISAGSGGGGGGFLERWMPVGYWGFSLGTSVPSSLSSWGRWQLGARGWASSRDWRESFLFISPL